MRVSLTWLKEFIDLPTDDPEELEEVLASLGMESDSIEHLTAPFSGVIVGRVEEIRPHPDADRIRLCTVDVGDETHEVVCGAWNFEVGAVVPVALPGAELTDGVTVEEREIRGVSSHGMICSPAELGLGSEADGILVLDGDHEVGSDFSSALPFPDVVFDLEITANRADEMSMLGVARELAAHYGLSLEEPAEPPAARGETAPIQVAVEDPEACPRFFAVGVTEVSVAPSPLWMQLRLAAAGVRPINNVVDITNYVMLELGQPLHAFDLDQIDGRELTVRRASEGESLMTLDGDQHALHPGDIVIADARSVVSVAGVMGGAGSEVSESTTKVLVEAANWNPVSIMGTSIALGLRTEASARFSRGVDPNLPPRAAARAAHLVADLGGGVVSGIETDVYPDPVTPWTVEVSQGDVSRLLGQEIDRTRIVQILESLGMPVEGADPLVVTVPTWRPDVTRPADIVEEVARLYGYNNLPESLPLGTGGGLTVVQLRTRRVRDALVGAGLHEAQSFSFMAPQDVGRLGLPPDDPRAMTVPIKNPVSEEEGVLRTTLLPGLLRATARNVGNGIGDVALFEVGRVFRSRPSLDDERLPSQPKMVSYVAVGGTGARGVSTQGRPADVFTATAIWNALAGALRLRETRLEAAEVPGFHPGRAAQVTISGQVIGALGELHPSAARGFDLPGRVAVAEIRLDPLVQPSEVWSMVEPSPFPPARFDLAFEVDQALAASTLLDSVAAADPLIESVRLFDEFTGGDLAADRKSLAVRVVLRAKDRTLSPEEVQEHRSRVIGSVSQETGASLRGEE